MGENVNVSVNGQVKNNPSKNYDHVFTQTLLVATEQAPLI